MLKRNGTKLYYMHAEVDGRLNFVLQHQLRVLHSTRGANRNGAQCDIVLSRDCVYAPQRVTKRRRLQAGGRPGF